MKIRYSKESDVLTIELKEGKLTDSRDLEEGIILHLGKNKEPLEIEILDASERTSLSEPDISGGEIFYTKIVPDISIPANIVAGSRQ